MSVTPNRTYESAGGDPGWLEIVRRQVGSLRFGVVQIVVHDSRVTQIERTERMRLDKPPPEISEPANTR